jgi:hypothetical protein
MKRMFPHLKLKHLAKLSIVSMSLAVAPVSASVVMISDDATLQQNYNEKFFSQSGISGDEVVVLDTAGDEMPLSFALSRIIPESWNIQTQGDANSTSVSWSGGVAWPHILRNIAHDEEVYVSLDWVQKIAAITVPKASANEYADSESIANSKNESEEFKARQLEKAERRNDNEKILARQHRQIDELFEKQRSAQESNQEYIARLNETNRQTEKEAERLREALETEKGRRLALEEKYAVVSPQGEIDVPDGAELFVQYEKRSVLPFDSSFEYFLKGGHADLITPETPATFIAKPGSVKQVVESWANEIGWALEYTAGVKHNNPYEVEFKGTFYEVGREFITIFRSSNRPLNITFHPDVKVDGKHGLVKVTDLNYSNR